MTARRGLESRGISHSALLCIDKAHGVFDRATA